MSADADNGGGGGASAFLYAATSTDGTDIDSVAHVATFASHADLGDFHANNFVGS